MSSKSIDSEAIMSQVIRIQEELYKRLEKYAHGFDTPANVIEKILDFYERHSGNSIEAEQEKPNQSFELPSSLEIIYHPGGENIFKQELLKKKQAYILLHKIDGTSELKVWNASKFSPDSTINGNLRSGYLRGWKNKGIYKAEVAINKADII